MKLLETIDRGMARVEGWVLIGILGTMVLLAFAQVILRNFFQAGFIWADILLRHMVLWIGFLGAAIATREEKHISIDALTRFLPPRVRSSVHALTSIFAAGVCAVLGHASIAFIENDVAFGSTVYGDVPSWYSQIIIPVGFALLCLHFLVRAAINARAALVGGEA
jgi:TRAP-type C4-dicarboxylate transport system permease small subunit